MIHESSLVPTPPVSDPLNADHAASEETTEDTHEQPPSIEDQSNQEQGQAEQISQQEQVEPPPPFPSSEQPVPSLTSSPVFRFFLRFLVLVHLFFAVFLHWNNCRDQRQFTKSLSLLPGDSFYAPISGFNAGRSGFWSLNVSASTTNSETWRVSVYAITGPEPKPTLWIDYPAKNVDVLSTRSHLNQFVRYKMVKESKLTFTFAVDHYGDQLPDLLVLSEYGGRLAMEERQFTSKAVIQNVTHTGSGEFTYIFTEADPTIYIGFCNKQPATRNTFTVETSTPTYNIKSLNISQTIHVSSIDDEPSARIPIGPDVTGLLFISNSTLDGMADWKNNGVQLRYEPGTDYIYVLFVAVWFMLIVWRFKQWFTNVKGNCVKWYQSRIRTDPDVEASMETVRVASHRLLVILTRVLGVIAYIGFFIVVPVLVMLGLQTLSLSKVDEHAVPFLVLMIPHLMYGAAPAILTLHTAMLALGMLQCVGINLWGPGGLFLGNVRNERRVVEGEDGNAEEAARLLEGDFEAESDNSTVDLEGLPPYEE